MIGAAITAALPVMRANAESLMTQTCTIERASSAWSEADQKTVTVWTPVHADIPCHLEETPAGSRSVVTGELVTVEGPLVKVSVDNDGAQPDDRVTVGDRELWVTSAGPDDTSHPVEWLLQCRRTR